MEIIESILLFNEQYKDQYVTKVSLLKHLDITCPQWRESIKDNIYWERINNFPESIDFAITVYDMELERINSLKFLAVNLANNWQKYPKFIKNNIFGKYEDIVKKFCTQQIWNSLSTIHKFTLVHHIVVDEYNYIHDVMSLYEYLTTEEGCRLPIITPEIRRRLDDIRHHQDRFFNRDETYMMDNIQHHISGCFGQPTVNYERMKYYPSEPLRRFQQFAETAGDTILANELQYAQKEIERSFIEVRY